MAKVALRGLKGRLVYSSVDAYVLALETINRLSVKYRVEGFCFLIVNAWELLLKARVIELEGKEKLFYSKESKKERKSIGLDSCIKKIYLSENDPIRCNLVKVAEIRNKSGLSP